MATQIVRIAATGTVGSANGGELHSVSLTAGSDAATLVVRESGASGSTILKLAAATGTTVERTFPGCAGYSGQLHGTLTGTSPEATFEV